MARRRRKRRARRTVVVPPGGAGPPRRRSNARPASRLYSLTEQHLRLFEEAARIRPELSALFDLGAIEPGSESIEFVSARLHRWLLERGFDKPVFMVFCHLNADRLQGAIGERLDEQGLPYDEADVVAEVYSRLFRFHLRQADQGEGAANADGVGWEAMGRGRSVFSVLQECALEVLDERVRALRASSVPMPGTPMPDVAPAQETVARAQEQLLARHCQLELKELRQWVAYALLGLPELDRRLIHLRTRRQLRLDEIAKRLGFSPFEAGRRLRAAVDRLHDALDAILEVFDPAAPGRIAESAAAGRILRGPGSEREASSPSSHRRGRIVRFPKPEGTPRKSEPVVGAKGPDDEDDQDG